MELAACVSGVHERWRGRAADPAAGSLAVSVSEAVARIFEQAYVATVTQHEGVHQ